jgi:hypothetical protein
MVLRVGYVHEHSSSPILQFAEGDKGATFTLTSCPGGTGQMIAALRNNEIDVAIALTDALIAGITRGEEYRLVGSFVETPLNWAVVTGKDSPYKSISDLKDVTIGISRVGSGSQVMASVMAMQQGWKDEKGDVKNPNFQVNKDIDGLIESVNDGTSGAFLWEWFTTKPFADEGKVRFIGSVLTPWSAWSIAAHTSPERADPDKVRAFVATLGEYVRAFDSDTSREKDNVDYIKKIFGYPEVDIRAWMDTVKYIGDCSKIEGKLIQHTLHILELANVVERPKEGFKIEKFTNEEVVRVV